MKILVTDDSKLIRKKVISNLSNLGDYTFFEAETGESAIKHLDSNPDIQLVILDINMPGIDGITTMQVIEDRYKIPCIIFSSFTKKNLNLTYEAIELGAFDVIHKPHGVGNYSFDDCVNDLHKCIINISNDAQKTYKSDLRGIIIIGMSTGGPKTIRDILPEVRPMPYHAIVIVQHMPESFIPSFAKTMNSYAQMPSNVAENNEEIKANHIYLAPGGKNLTISDLDGKIVFKLSPLVEGQYFSPCIDQTFISAAKIFGRNLMSIILTGMGSDGAQGAVYVKKHGGFVVTESKDSCIVNGMPKSTKELAKVDLDLHKNEIARVINNYNSNKELVA